MSESAYDYPVLAASGRWLVIRCKDDMQFIVQRRQAGAAEWPWRAMAYVLNGSRLPAVLQRASTGIPADDLAALLRDLVPMPKVSPERVTGS
jgi:hypothetical protein